MKRRSFIKNTTYSLAVILAPTTPFLFQRLRPIEELTKGSIYLAKPGAVVKLPSDPSTGDFIHIITDVSSVTNPCTLQFNGVTIAGYSCDVELDVISNIRLKYDNSNGWIIS
jgi:hypothetical protein